MPGPDAVEPPIGGLCRILLDGRPRVAVLTAEGLVTTSLASPLDAIVGGRLDAGVLAAARLDVPRLAIDAVTFLPPVEPRTALYCGRNYEDHLAENPRPRQATPVLFAKLVGSLTGHRSPILVSDDQRVDYEGELVVVIGRRARRIRAEEALDVVAGYTIANDVSDRAVQHVNNQVTMGKGPDTFGPLGPYLVERAALGDGSGLRLRTWVDDELRQDGDTSELIHDVRACVEAATRTVTLLPGDIIATGTPAGVGAYMDPPRFLRPGQTVTVAIDGLGSLTNPVRADGAGQDRSREER